LIEERGTARDWREWGGENELPPVVVVVVVVLGGSMV